MAALPTARLLGLRWWSSLAAWARHIVRRRAIALQPARIQVPEYAGGGYVDLLPPSARDDRPGPTRIPGPGARSSR